jgi:hypothetical protein
MSKAPQFRRSHLQAVLDSLRQELLQHGGTLAGMAKEGFQRHGRGAIVQVYSSVHDAINAGEAPVMYQPAAMVKVLEYMEGDRLIKTYDPLAQFVLIAGMHLKRGEGVFNGWGVDLAITDTPGATVAETRSAVNMLPVRVCARVGCGAPATSSCGKCRGTRYCSKECQTADWPSHKKHVCAVVAAMRNADISTS